MKSASLGLKVSALAVIVFTDFSLVAIEENNEKLGQNWSHFVQKKCEFVANILIFLHVLVTATYPLITLVS